MGSRQAGPAVASVCHQRLRLCGDEQPLSSGAQSGTRYSCQLERAGGGRALGCPVSMAAAGTALVLGGIPD